MKFPVSPAKNRELQTLMEKYRVLEADLMENFIRGTGAGGQKINKTSSCVQLLHKPTGIEVRCQQARSQALNRFLARQLLVRELASRLEKQASEKQMRLAKIRRQKRRRSRRTREKMLADKKHQGAKKHLRQAVKATAD